LLLPQALSRDGQWEETVGLLSAMKDAKLPPDVISYTTAITACGRKGQWRRALELSEARHPEDSRCVSVSGLSERSEKIEGLSIGSQPHLSSGCSHSSC
jgi:pentatricopeptide repeat protein